jgi:SnoaL-like polyketide cyclase
MFMVGRLVRENARWQNEEEQEVVGMSAEEKNKAVVRRFTEEFYNRGNIDVAYELLAPDYVDHDLLPGEQATIEDYKREIDEQVFGFPRLRALVAEYGEERSLGQALLEELYSFVGEGWVQEDDITLLTLKRSASLS